MNESANTFWYGVGNIGKELGPKAWEDRALRIIKNHIIPKVSLKWQQTLEKHKEEIAKVSGFIVTAVEIGVVAGVTYGGIHALIKRIKEKKMGSGFDVDKHFWKANKPNSPQVRDMLVKNYKPFTPVVAGAIVTAPLALKYREEQIPAPEKITFSPIIKRSPQKEKAARYKAEAFELRQKQIGDPSTYFDRAKVGGKRWKLEHPPDENPKDIVQKKPDELADYYARIRKANQARRQEEAAESRRAGKARRGEIRRKIHNARYQENVLHAKEVAWRIGRKIRIRAHQKATWQKVTNDVNDRLERESQQFQRKTELHNDPAFYVERAFAQGNFVEGVQKSRKWYETVLQSVKHRSNQKKDALLITRLVSQVHSKDPHVRNAAAETLLQLGFDRLPPDVKEQFGEKHPNFIAKADFWTRRLHNAGLEPIIDVK